MRPSLSSALCLTLTITTDIREQTSMALQATDANGDPLVDDNGDPIYWIKDSWNSSNRL